MNTVTLFEEYRGDVLECVHQGMVCAVDEGGVVASAGDTGWTCFYRSSSKPIQVLPVLMRGLDVKYGLTDRETAIFSASHQGDPEHVEALESILQKTGLREEHLVMLPTYPGRPAERERLLRAGMPPRRLYHNCSGKHLAMMLLARELGEPVEQYWMRGSRTQSEILDVISRMTDVPAADIRIGLDGCGVPVYAVPFERIARSYLRMARPELISDPALRTAVERNAAIMNAHPQMISGAGRLCSVLNANPDLCCKGGAQGVYAMGIRSLGLGVVFKIMDGSQDEFAACAISILRQLGYDAAFVNGLAQRFPDVIVNDNREEAGYRKAVFTLR